MVSKNHKLARAIALALFGAASSMSQMAHAQAQTAQGQTNQAQTSQGQTTQADASTPSEQVDAAEAQANASTAQTSAVTIALINELVKQGIISLERAQQLLEAAEREASLARQRQTPPPANQVRVPYVPESVKQKMREELRAEIAVQAKSEGWGAPGALPGWLNRVQLGGDFRLRYHGDFFDKNNFPFSPDIQAINDRGGVTTTDGFPFLNTTDDRNRERYRARLNATVRVTDGVKVEIGLASGENNGPISTNKSFGDYLTKDPVWIDAAYIEARPFDDLTFTGGRMPNPFYSTDLVWDPDLRLEGVALTGSHAFGGGANAPIVSLIAGAFPLRELADGHDSWLYGAQLGTHLTFGSVDFRLGGAYYDFSNVQSKLNPPDGSRLNDFTRPPLIGPGNSVFNMRTDGLTTLAGLASKYRLVDVTAEVQFRFGTDKAVRIVGDYVRNLDLDAQAIDALRGEPGVTPGDTGWQARFQVGSLLVAHRHDWNLALAYRSLETDAVLAAFTDSDFGAYGGTDLKGFMFEASYGLATNTWLSLEWDSADSIDRPPFSSDVILFDLNTRF